MDSPKTQQFGVFYRQLVAALHSLPGSWPCSTLVKQHRVNKFLVKEEVKQAKSFHRLNA
jgi:hypothetical protein